MKTLMHKQLENIFNILDKINLSKHFLSDKRGTFFLE